jgi:phage/plasmid-like protein (TIGR03299 family)
MAYAVERGVPWHGLGTPVDGVMTAQAALVAAGLDWEVELRPVFTVVDDSGRRMLPIPIPTRRAVVRTSDDSPLGVVGTDYVPFQNREAFRFADNLVDSSDAKYETAASLRGGRTVFLAMRAEGFDVDGFDEHEMYLLLVTSHDGLKAVTCLPTPVRVVCRNTLNMAIRGAKRVWTARHVGDVQGRLQEARAALGLTLGYRDALQAELEALLAQPFTERRLRTTLNAVIPDRPQAEGARDAVVDLFLHSGTNEFGRGTKLGALNAVGEYFDWARNPRTEESRVIGTLPGGAAAKARDRMLAALSS